MNFPARSLMGSMFVPNPIDVSLLQDIELTPTNASASIQFANDGVITVVGNGSSAGPLWHLPQLTGIGASYWIRCDVTSGDAPTSGDSTGAWHALTSPRSWIWTQTISGTKSATISLSIATDAAGANIVAAKTGLVVYVEETI